MFGLGAVKNTNHVVVSLVVANNCPKNIELMRLEDCEGGPVEFNLEIFKTGGETCAL